MANHPSAIKRHRQSERRAQRNQAERSRVRSAVKKVRAVTTGSDSGAAQEELKAAAKVLQKAASKGVIHRNNASRRIARLARLVGGTAGAS